MANMANADAYQLPDGRMAVDVTENKTLTQADSGYVQNVTVDGVVLTSPATATVGQYTGRNGGGVDPTDDPHGDGTVGFSIAPATDDQFIGGVAGTPGDNKKLINTKATARYGNEITWACHGVTAGPIVVGPVKGIFAREP